MADSYYNGAYTGAEVDQILGSVAGKITRPLEGTAGQVLHTDGNGNSYWGAGSESNYVYIRYAAHEPTQDSDISETPNDWMGVYSGTSETAPTSYLLYKWYRIKGAGEPAEVVGQLTEYQASSSGSTIPTGEWSETVPAVPQGYYLWTKTYILFNSGDPIIIYNSTRYGMDGSGTVSSVDNISPDSNGNVNLGAYKKPTTGIPKSDLSESVQNTLDNVKSITVSGTKLIIS